MTDAQRAFAEKMGAEFIAEMEELVATVKAGGLEAVKKRFKVTTLADLIPSPEASATDVAAARKSLGVSQPVFARILGASVQAVRAWEQGAKPPSGVARRLIGEIRHDPDYWRKRFRLPTPPAQAATPKPTGKPKPKRRKAGAAK